MTEDLQYSRPLATAEQLGELAPDRHRFPDKRVVLTGEAAVLETQNGRGCLLDSIRLLVRITRNLEVRLPKSARILASEAGSLADRIAFGRRVEVSHNLGINGADAILSVGSVPHADGPCTLINANGWVARVSSGPTPLPGDCGQPNPISTLAAASIGVAEVFKRLIAVDLGRGPMLDGLEWSLMSYQIGDGDPGPAVTGYTLPHTLLVGAGAIGNGIIHLLGQLRLQGTLYVVDRQAYAEENLGTCILIGPGEVGKKKAHIAAASLRQPTVALPYPEELAGFRKRLGHDLQYPSIVLGAVDDVVARRELQDLWPDLVLDGAIGAFGCQVSRHSWTDDLACLKCLFEEGAGEAAEVVASLVTGLRAERIATAGETAVILADDVHAAPPEKRELLRGNIGRLICSVVSEEMVRHVSAAGNRALGFAPSVPFVACLSGAMVVGELVKELAGWPTALETRYQMDALTGPAFGDMFPQHRRPTCLCVQRRRIIDQLRAERGTLRG